MLEILSDGVALTDLDALIDLEPPQGSDGTTYEDIIARTEEAGLLILDVVALVDADGKISIADRTYRIHVEIVDDAMGRQYVGVLLGGLWMHATSSRSRGGGRCDAFGSGLGKMMALAVAAVHRRRARRERRATTREDMTHTRGPWLDLRASIFYIVIATVEDHVPCPIEPISRRSLLFYGIERDRRDRSLGTCFF